MAEGSKSTKRSIKKTETLRERAEKAGNKQPRQRRLRKTASRVVKPFSAAKRVGKKEVNLPLPDSKVGRLLNKRVRLFPRFFREAFQELRLVTWPSRKETWKLTSAVFVFAISFGIIIAITDYGLDKLFRKLILK